MSNLVDVFWLSKHYNDEDVKIIDCRYDFLSPEYGCMVYFENHIPNSYFFDINKDASGVKKLHGGAKPLPDLSFFREKIEMCGIKNDTTIILYDDGFNGAPRLWWLFKYINHQHCYILNGGYQAWLKNKLPITTELPSSSPVNGYEISVDNTRYCDLEYIKKRKDLQEVVLIDGRTNEKYLGYYEPVYPKAGHIPGALNHPSENSYENCYIKNKETLEKQFQEFLKYDEIILCCGSGISACGNCFALEEIGISTRVYIGGFSDWISYDENPVASANTL